jgi:hypothetical protein
VLEQLAKTTRYDLTLHGRRLWRAWTLWATVGEATGFAAPALAGALLTSASAAAEVSGLLAAGAVEGALLSWAQSRVLVRAPPALDRRRWIGATSAAAVLAWAIGLVPVLAATG